MNPDPLLEELHPTKSTSDVAVQTIPTEPPNDEEVETIVEQLEEYEELEEHQNFAILNEGNNSEINYTIIDPSHEEINYRIISDGNFVKEENLSIEPVKVLNRDFENFRVKREVQPPTQLVQIKSKQNRPKILNKGIQGPTIQLNDPKIQRNRDGQIEIITEVQTFEATNQIKKEDPDDVAETVPTHVFSCNMCERSFPLKQLLEIHQRNHTRERNHPCSFCDKKFFSKYDLAKHVLTHTGERPYEVNGIFLLNLSKFS